MQEETTQSLSDRIVNILEQLLQQLADSSADSDNDDDDTQGSVAELIVDVHVLNNPNYSEDAEVRIHEAELLPQLIPEKRTSGVVAEDAAPEVETSTRTRSSKKKVVERRGPLQIQKP